MSVATLSVRRPVLMTVMALVIILLGAFGASNLGVREYPNVDYPLIQVRTSYPGANAAVVEAEVTEILEASINSASGIKALTSTSRDGFSFINIEFETGMDLEAAANEIRDRVSRVRRRLPDDVDEPTVYKSDSDSDPILMVSLVSDRLDPMEVSELANNFVKERLQTINGVSEVAIWGEKRPTVRLWIDPVRLQALGVSGAEMSAALKKGNLELPSGSIEGSETTLSIRTLGRILDPKSFENIAVKTAADGTVIRISDVADIHYEPKDTRTGFRRNGKNSITLALMAQPGSNHVEIADEFYKRVEDIRREIPEGVDVLYGRDTSVNIRASIREVVETIFIAFLLVIAIIFAFLREGRTTLIPMVVVPVSVIGSFFVLYLCGFSINVLTLLAMVLAIGLVVDDAIVIVENIYHKIEKGMTPKQAAVAGTNEIFFAVIATSVVLMAVFVPVLALGGTTGLLFREFVAVMIGTVFLSTLCALTLSPMLCSKFLRKQKQGWFFRVTEPFFDWLNRIYSVLLGGFLRLRILLFPVVAALLVAAYFCFNNMSSEMAPTEDSNAVMVNLNMPEGVTLTRTKRMADAFAEEVISLLDSNEYSEIQAGAWNAGNSRMRITLNDDKEARRPQSEIARVIQLLGNEYPDLRVMVFEPQSISTQRGGLPVQFVLQAPNIEILRTLVPKFEEEASKSPVFSVVNTNLRFTKPELHIEILRDKANEEGVSVNDIAQAVQLAISDQSYGEFYKDGRQYDIIGAVGYQYRSMPENISMLTVKNAKGELVSLDNFITFKEQSASPSLPRYNRFSAATIQAGLVPGKTIGDGVEEMRRIAKRLLKDYPNVSTALSGSSKEFEESSSGLYIVFLLALALVFLVLAGQFESFRAPFVIFFTVPLALAGALACLFLTGQTLNIFSEIALILLIALVTKNGILIVEFANQIAASTGCSKLEAARMAAERRFRPILMTSLSTVLGAVPLILTGTPSRIAMGIAIAGGLTFATFMTLFIVPAAYSFFAGKVRLDAMKSTDASKMA
jgi:multidrug efflux pump